MGENTRIFLEWQEQIKNFPKLEFNDAKKLYKALLKEENLLEQKKIRDELICGTLHFIGKQISNNHLFFIKSIHFDMNDVIDAYIEEWIKEIDAGRLLYTERLSSIFDITFISRVVSNLIGKKDNSELSIPNFSDFLIQYITIKGENGKVKRGDFFSLIRQNLTQYDEDYLFMVYNILEKLANAFEEYGIEINKTNAKKFKYLLIMYAMELMRADIDKIKVEDVSEQVIDRLYGARVVQSVLSSDLTDREKDVLVMHFGLNGSNSCNYDTIAQKHKITKSRVLQIECRALRRLRHPSRLKNIKIWREW